MTDWKDIYQGLPREIRNAVSRSTQKDRKDPIKIYTERLERHLSRSSKTDWKDTYQGIHRKIGKTPIKVFQERLERLYQGLHRKI
jgi:coproporphyrinogen III oxidase-like Fe-S oxidoreductase